MSKQIKVGYDGSESSLEAVMWAAREAVVRATRLLVVSCYRIPLAGDEVSGWAATEAYVSLREAAESCLLDVRDVVAGVHPGLEILTESSVGPAGPALVDDVGPDELVVVGASSHQGAAAFWLGSTPRYVVRHSPCPVVVVRGAASRGRPDRIVVGVDGSTASEKALEWAGEEAERHQVDLLVVHGWLYAYVSDDRTFSQGRDLTRVDAACVLDRALEFAGERFTVNITRQLVEGGPVTALLDTVRDGDLLVLGSRGRGALTAGILGSTVNSVLDRCVVPVVVVRGADEF